MTSTIDAKELIFRNRRFDLIYKYLYSIEIVACRKASSTLFYEGLYSESIRAFNGFYEELPRKNSREDFVRSFKSLIKSIQQKGFDTKWTGVPVSSNFDLFLDGAHRVAVAASLGLRLPVYSQDGYSDYDYKLFLKNGMDADYMDFGALKYLELNPHAYVVNLHSINSLDKDPLIESILEKYGFIYYKKNIGLNINGYINLKKISYGFNTSEHTESWIGNYQNGFPGAREHATLSFKDGNPLRAYIFVCDSINTVRKAKKEIRACLDLGNHAVHINDTKAEGLSLGQIFFNDRSIHLMNTRPYDLDTSDFDEKLDAIKCLSAEVGVSLHDFALTGSGVLAAYGLRHARDIDLLHLGDLHKAFENAEFSSHTSQQEYYAKSMDDLTLNPRYYFYYRGVKVSSLEVVRKMKIRRDENPKDRNDIDMIESVQKKVVPRYVESPLSVKKILGGLFSKEKFARHRIIRFLGIPVFKYYVRGRK